MTIRLLFLDIWALGVFLYKLCYYTTPFEEHGPLAIINVQYTIPPYPAYSNSIKYLIGQSSCRPNSERNSDSVSSQARCFKSPLKAGPMCGQFMSTHVD